MISEIFKIDPENIDTDIIKYCAGIIKKGGLVCFPTETVYGLGANAFDPQAVSNIFKAKGRPNDNPLIVHVSDYEMINIIADAPEYQLERLKKLGNKYWPGPLTMIVEKDTSVPDEVSCGLSTVGIRMPSNKIALALIKQSGVPIAAPSANLSGKPSPSCFEHCYRDLNGKVDVIIDGGNCSVGVESTVLDLTSDIPDILRPGAITLENVREVLGKGDIYDWLKTIEGQPKSPGMKYKHYSPNADITIYQGDVVKVRTAVKNAVNLLKNTDIKTGIMTTNDGIEFFNGYDNVISMGDRSNPITITQKLFQCLREFDDLGVQIVFAEGIEPTGIGNAVMNRLYRAAGGKMIYC